MSRTVLAPLRDRDRGGTTRFPHEIRETNPSGSIVFVYDTRTGNEASSAEENARGRISFAPVMCRIGSTIRFTVNALLGSELSDHKAIRVSGTFRGVIDRPPSRWR